MACATPHAPVQNIAPAATPSAPTLAAAEEAIARGEVARAEEMLRELAHSGEADARTDALVRLARLFDAQSRNAEAVTAWSRVAHDRPLIEAHARLRQGEALARAGETRGAIGTLEQVRQRFPRTAASESAGIRLLSLYAATGNGEGANRMFRALDDVSIDSYVDSALVEEAARLDALGQPEMAARVRLLVLDRYPRSRFTEQIAADPGTRAFLDGLGMNRMLAVAANLGAANRNDQALDVLERIEKIHPDSPGDPRFIAVRLRTLFSARRYDEVCALEVPVTHPSYRELELLRARAHWRRDRNAEFRTRLLRIMSESPDSAEAGEARILLAKYHVTDEVDYDASIRYLREAIAAGLTGNDGENVWTLGWTELVAGRDDDALATFAESLRRWPLGDYATNALFWTGKTHGRAGRIPERDEAFARLARDFPYSYYTYRARELAGSELATGSSGRKPEVFPDLTLPADGALAQQLAVVDALDRSGLPSASVREMRKLVSASADNPALWFRLADLHARTGEPLTAIGILQRRFRGIVRHGGEGVPRRFWEILYPLEHWDTVEGAAKSQSMDPYLIVAIIRQESGFDSDIVSNAGAVGLMQLMPQELPRITRDASLEPATREDLFDPDRNIVLGVAEIRQKFDAVPGPPALAIAAYNAGVPPVSRWVERFGLTDIDVFVESITYAETKLYVKTVTRNWHEYRRIYLGTPGV